MDPYRPMDEVNPFFLIQNHSRELHYMENAHIQYIAAQAFFQRDKNIRRLGKLIAARWRWSQCRRQRAAGVLPL